MDAAVARVMTHTEEVRTAVLVRIGEVTNRTLVLPLLINLSKQ